MDRLLIANPSYLGPEDFIAFPNDYCLDSYWTKGTGTVGGDSYVAPDYSRLQSLLNAASARVNGYMRQSYFPVERTKRIRGNGSKYLPLNDQDIIYVRSIYWDAPNFYAATIPAHQMLIDFSKGTLEMFAPLLVAGGGYFAMFARNVPIDVTYARGLNFPIAPPTTVTFAYPSSPTPLAAGQYDVAITAATMGGGESLPFTQTVTVPAGGGAIAATITPALGAYVYRVYARPHDTGHPITDPTGYIFVQEVLGCGDNTGVIVASFTRLAPQTGVFPRTLPTVDTTAEAFPAEIVEATRIVALGMLKEEGNLANRGVQQSQEATGRIRWQLTNGTSALGKARWELDAMALVAPYKFDGVF